MHRIPRQPAPGARQTTRLFSSIHSLGLNRTERIGRINEPINNIAVLGGGITGLASAYFATKVHPGAKITLFESSNRFGGWIRSTKHNVKGGMIVFEHGPRSLRPARGTVGLISALGLGDQLLLTSKTSPAARNRYVYLEDRLINVQPGTSGISGISGMLQEPVLKETLLELGRTFFQTSRPSIPDETLGQFFRRRGLTSTANNLFSAMIHGIYAGDIDELSARNIYPNLTSNEIQYGSPWNFAWRQGLNRLFGLLGPVSPVPVPGSTTRALVAFSEDKLNVNMNDPYLRAAMSASIYTLKGGLETLVTTLVDSLKKHPNVQLYTGATIQKMQPVIKPSGNSSRATSPKIPPNPKLRLLVHCNRQEGLQNTHAKLLDSEYDGIISAIPSASLAKLCPLLKDSFSNTPAATVGVVNLFYDQPDLLPVRGFGYLIPKATPERLNPEGALGVVFDSDATPDLDTVLGTKLTVMLGGPHWKGLSQENIPSNADAIELAKAVLAAHLGITQEPTLAQANVQVNCIPQYVVGHGFRMHDAREALNETNHWARLKVAGSWYNGVAINDCISSALIANYLLEYPMFGNEPLDTLHVALQ